MMCQITLEASWLSKTTFPQDGVMVPFGMDEKSKPRLEVTGTKYVFSIDNPQSDDAGFYQVDVGEANVLSTDFRGNVQPVSIC